MKWLYSVVCKGVSLQHTTSTIYIATMLGKLDKAFKKAKYFLKKMFKQTESIPLEASDWITGHLFFSI
jgi:hypothetical protein